VKTSVLFKETNPVLFGSSEIYQHPLLCIMTW